MRLALLGAFVFPAPLGSQRFFGAQAAALADAGARVTLFCHAGGAGAVDPRLELVRTPRLLAPRALRAGPSAGKPLADAALARALLRAARRQRFDAVLAHNAEAACVALAARALGGPPVVYVAHTLMGRELDAWTPRAVAGLSRRFGGALDRTLAARADGVIALCRDAAAALQPHARGPLDAIVPGWAPEAPPGAGEVGRACAAAGVAPGGFALYTGNVDRYQQLGVLAEAARRAPELPVLIATHGAARFEAGGVRCARLSPEATRALTHGAALALLPRRRPGGFPIKLLEYMAASRAIVAREGIAEGLEHARTAWLVPRDADADAFAAALRALHADPGLRERLGSAARRRIEHEHAWPALAQRTLALVESARTSARGAESALGSRGRSDWRR